MMELKDIMKQAQQAVGGDYEQMTVNLPPEAKSPQSGAESKRGVCYEKCSSDRPY